MKIPSKGPHSPYSAGNRTLVARTCSSCGELADGDSFPLINQGRGGRRKTCHKCTNAKKKAYRQEHNIVVPRPEARLQTSKYQVWTAEEDNFLRENVTAMSYEAIATALGRSLNSVYTRRGILGLATVRKRHRVEKPWKVRK